MSAQAINWSEGMFLLPQHFQQQDHHHHYHTHRKMCALCHDVWGLIHIEFNVELLHVGKIAIDSCEAIFNDGRYYQYPGEDVAPDPLSIGSDQTGSLIYLALLERQAKPEEDVDARHHVGEVSMDDLGRTDHTEQLISINKLKPRFLTEKEEAKAYNCIPIARVKSVKSTEYVKLEEQFLPTLLDVSSNKRFNEIIEKLLAQLDARAHSLADRLHALTAANASEVIDHVLLQLLNRYKQRLENFKAQPNAHPRYLYHLMTELLCELATYTDASRRILGVDPYDHRNLTKSFDGLLPLLDRLLNQVLEQAAEEITLHARDFGVWTSQIENKDVFADHQFVLAVTANVSFESLRDNLPAQIKIAAASSIGGLVSRGLPGVAIKALANAPRQIPFHADAIYFRLEQNVPLWQDIIESAAIAVHVSGDYPGLDMQLWAIRA